MEAIQSHPDTLRLVYFAVLTAFSLALPWVLSWRGLTADHEGRVPVMPRQFWPLLLTFPALLLGLGREATFLQALSGLDAVFPVLGSSERVLLLIYLAAGAALYYRPPAGRAVWALAAALCAVPMLLAMQAAWAGGIWADESGGGGNLLPDLLAFGLSLAAWVGFLLAQRLPAARAERALA